MSLQSVWEHYKRSVLHPEATDVQIRECRMAFYAGALTMNEAYLSTSELEISEEASAAIIEGFHQELRAFLAMPEARNLKRALVGR